MRDYTKSDLSASALAASAVVELLVSWALLPVEAPWLPWLATVVLLLSVARFALRPDLIATFATSAAAVAWGAALVGPTVAEGRYWSVDFVDHMVVSGWPRSLGFSLAAALALSAASRGAKEGGVRAARGLRWLALLAGLHALGVATSVGVSALGAEVLRDFFSSMHGVLCVCLDGVLFVVVVVTSRFPQRRLFLAWAMVICGFALAQVPRELMPLATEREAWAVLEEASDRGLRPWPTTQRDRLPPVLLLAPLDGPLVAVEHGSRRVLSRGEIWMPDTSPQPVGVVMDRRATAAHLTAVAERVASPFAVVTLDMPGRRSLSEARSLWSALRHSHAGTVGTSVDNAGWPRPCTDIREIAPEALLAEISTSCFAGVPRPPDPAGVRHHNPPRRPLSWAGFVALAAGAFVRGVRNRAMG